VNLILITVSYFLLFLIMIDHKIILIKSAKIKVVQQIHKIFH